MRYRAFPVAHRNRPRSSQPRQRSIRRTLTLFGAALVFGGLLRLATDDTVAEVATADLSRGPTRAASSEPEPAPEETELHADALDAAIVSMLGHDP